jgi:hypothetical protein
MDAILGIIIASFSIYSLKAKARLHLKKECGHLVGVRRSSDFCLPSGVNTFYRVRKIFAVNQLGIF